MDNESCNRKRSQICVRSENEIPLFREFPFSGTTNKPFSQNLSGIHLLVSGTISEEALITSYFGPVNWNLLKVSSQFEYLPTRKARARNVIFLSLDCGNLTLDHQLVWCQILVFHFPTDATLQFLSKLTIYHSKYGWLAVGSFRCCLLTGNNKQVWTTFLRSSTSSRWLKTLEMSLASMPNSFHLAAVFL